MEKKIIVARNDIKRNKVDEQFILQQDISSPHYVVPNLNYLNMYPNHEAESRFLMENSQILLR